MRLISVRSASVYASIALFYVVLSGCGKRPIAPNAIRIGVLLHSSSIPIIIAAQNHYFADKGIDVHLATLSNEQHMPALLRDDVDIISPSTFPLIFSAYVNHGKSIECFLVGGESSGGEPLYAIVVPRDSKARSLGDLVGMTIGSASKFTILNLRVVLASKFADQSGRTTIREFTSPTLLLDGLRSGALNAAVFDQPTLSTHKVGQDYKRIEENFRARYIADPYWSGAGVVRVDWVRAHRDLYERFLDAIDQSLAFCSQNPDKAKDIFVSYFGLHDITHSAIGMYLYPKARYVPPEPFVSFMKRMLIRDKMLSSDFNAADLFYHQ